MASTAPGGRSGRAAVAAKSGKVEDREREALLHRVRELLERGGQVSALEMGERDRGIVRELGLLTAKPMLYVANTGEEDPRGEGPAAAALREAKGSGRVIPVSVRVEEEIEGTHSVGYDLLFYCLDFIVSSRVRSFSFENRTFVLLWQAEDKEFDEISPVFSAITTSLLNPSKRAAARGRPRAR